MNEEQPSQPSQQLTQEPKSKKKPIIISLIILVLLAGTGYAVYAWQQSRVNELEAEVKTLKDAKATEDIDTDTEAADTYKTPTGYLEYTVTTPDFSFAYPKSIGSLNLTTENLNAAKYKGQGVKGASITIAPTTNTANNDNSFRVLTATTDYVPFGGDDSLAVFTLKGYTKSGSTYTVPLTGNNKISSFKGFEVIKTRSGEEAVVFYAPVAEGGESPAIGMINLPTVTGYKAVGITASSMNDVKSIMATIKVGK